MNSKSQPKNKQQRMVAVDDTQPEPPQVEPPHRSIGYGHPEYNFMTIALEIQKTLGEMKSDINKLNESHSSLRTKVEDLVKWKTLILGGAITIGIVFSILVTVFTKFSDYISFGKPSTQSESISQPSNAPADNKAPQPSSPGK